MSNDHSVDKLTKCIKDAKRDPAKVTACEDAFQTDGGKVFVPDEGGKVFVGVQGGKVFITYGGKVF